MTQQLILQRYPHIIYNLFKNISSGKLGLKIWSLMCIIIVRNCVLI